MITIIHKYALLGEGKTIHPCGQIEWYKNDVNNKLLKVGGLQHITTNDGYYYPLDIKNVIPYFTICPYTDDDWEALSYVVWTSDQ